MNNRELNDKVFNAYKDINIHREINIYMYHRIFNGIFHQQSYRINRFRNIINNHFIK